MPSTPSGLGPTLRNVLILCAAVVVRPFYQIEQMLIGDESYQLVGCNRGKYPYGFQFDRLPPAKLIMYGRAKCPPDGLHRVLAALSL